MNAMNGVAKVMVCGAAALALTVAIGWTFVEATASAPWVDMPTVVIVARADHAGLQLAQSAAAGLLQ